MAVKIEQNQELATSMLSLTGILIKPTVTGQMKEKDKTVKGHPAATTLIIIFRRFSKFRVVWAKAILILDMILPS